jgi:hypothetical protein
VNEISLRNAWYHAIFFTVISKIHKKLFSVRIEKDKK